MEQYGDTRKDSARPFLLASLLVFVIGFALGYALRGALTGLGPADTRARVDSLAEEDRQEGSGPSPIAETPEKPPRRPAEIEEGVIVSRDEAAETALAQEPVPDEVELAAEAAEYEAEMWPARHLFVSVKGTSLDPDTRAFLEEFKPGGVVLLGPNIQDREQTVALVKSIKEAVGLGEGIADLPLIAVDQEGGPVNRLQLEDAPSASELGSAEDAALARATGHRYATACIARGIGVLFAPVLDVYEPGAIESMETRSFGEDGALVAALGLAFAEGAMEAGVIPVAKHYPGHGAARQDSHDSLAVLAKDIPELAQVMYPFAEAVAQKIPGIMVGHIAVPALDTDHPERPASISPMLVHELLRGRWDYNGVVLTDDIDMRAMTKQYSVEQGVVDALQAGCDAVMLITSDLERLRAACRAIEAAVDEGTLPLARLRESRKRLEGWQAWLQNPTTLRGPLPPVPKRRVAALPPEPVPEPAPEPAAEPTPEPAPEPAVTQPLETVVVRHLVKRGETLTRIAGNHGVRVNEIMAWNGLKSPNINFGDVLVIRVTPEKAKQLAAAKPPPPTPAPPPPNTRKIVHRVQRRETLTAVAAEYGVSQEDILAWTGLDDPNLRYGQNLIIYLPME